MRVQTDREHHTQWQKGRAAEQTYKSVSEDIWCSGGSRLVMLSALTGFGVDVVIMQQTFRLPGHCILAGRLMASMSLLDGSQHSYQWVPLRFDTSSPSERRQRLRLGSATREHQAAKHVRTLSYPGHLKQASNA